MSDAEPREASDAAPARVEEALDQIAHRWSGWYGWIGVNGLLYARRPRTSPPVVVRAGNIADLHQLVEEAEARMARWRL